MLKQSEKDPDLHCSFRSLSLRASRVWLALGRTGLLDLEEVMLERRFRRRSARSCTSSLTLEISDLNLGDGQVVQAPQIFKCIVKRFDFDLNITKL